MQTLAVICPLELSANDREWIEGIRARHDPQHRLIEAHFTLVFPMSGIPLETMTEHVGQIARRTPTIDFQLERASAVRDSFAPRTHVFLLPSQGAAEVRNLHAALYVDELAPSLRTDIPYHPHVTVAAFEAQTAAEVLARELGEFRIVGRLRTMTVVSVNDGAIRDEGLFRLL